MWDRDDREAEGDEVSQLSQLRATLKLVEADRDEWKKLAEMPVSSPFAAAFDVTADEIKRLKRERDELEEVARAIVLHWCHADVNDGTHESTMTFLRSHIGKVEEDRRDYRSAVDALRERTVEMEKTEDDRDEWKSRALAAEAALATANVLLDRLVKIEDADCEDDPGTVPDEWSLETMDEIRAYLADPKFVLAGEAKEPTRLVTMFANYCKEMDYAEKVGAMDASTDSMRARDRAWKIIQEMRLIFGDEKKAGQ